MEKGAFKGSYLRIFFLSCIVLAFLLAIGLNFSHITGFFASCSDVTENAVSANASLDDFEVWGDFISLVLVQGGTLEESIFLKNTGRTTIEISPQASNLDDFLVIPDGKITILPGESEKIRLRFYALQNQKSGVYNGLIRFKGTGGIERIANVIVEVRSLRALFDLSIKILPEDKEIHSGESLGAIISMTNLAKTGDAVKLKMQIADGSKNTIIDSSEEVLGNIGNISLKREFKTYGYLSPGKYILIAKISYDNASAESYDSFEVVQSGISWSSNWIYLVLITVILSELLIIFYIFYRWAVHFGILKTKIVHEMRINEEKKKLRGKLKGVEQKFRKSEIAKPTYITHKDKIIMELNKLDRLGRKVRLERLGEEKAEALSYKKYKLKSELKKLKEGYKNGVISSEGYVKTRNNLERQIQAISERLRK